MADPVGIALVYPGLLGTYGDGGNARVLQRRLTWRGTDAEVVSVEPGQAVPEGCALYLLGGGEDGPQTQAAGLLGEEGALRRAVEGGAVLLAVCAGLQIAGHTFPDGPRQREGLGLLDIETLRTGEERAVGELAVDPDPALGLGRLTGFENHAGRTRLGPDARPLGAVRVGVGNGSPSAPAGSRPTEGAVTEVGRGLAVGTYLHGPALARNPALADWLLARALGTDELEPLDDTDVEALRAERLAAVAHGHTDGVAHRSWRDRLLRRS